MPSRTTPSFHRQSLGVSSIAARLSVALSVALSAACHSPPGLPGAALIDAAPPVADARIDAPPQACDLSGTPVEVDLLFVIGNGERSDATQNVLLSTFKPFFERLSCELGAVPNLHIGVVSANLGAGGFDVPRCTGNGDDGALLSSPRIAGCTGPTESFLLDEDDGNNNGGRTTNYEGTLEDAVTCIARLGTSGCTFEQPLAAALRATDGTHNDGFLRSGATLGVIIAAGADDCSAADPSLFDAEEFDTLGPLSSFRCFEQGVECSPDSPRTIGEKTNCVPRAGSVVSPVADLATTLRARKADPTDVIIGYMGGIPTDVVVIDQDPEGSDQILASTCPAPLDALPAVRMSAVPGAIGAITCLPSPSNLNPVADAIAASAASALD